MPKITVRIPTEQYAYIEVTFKDLKEYETQYPKVASAIILTKAKAAEAKAEALAALTPPEETIVVPEEPKNDLPFKGDEYSKK